MKKLVLFLFLGVFATFGLNAQTSSPEAKVTKITLEQTPGKFTQQSLNLDAGKYIFHISNNAVGKDVGFVVAPKGQTDQANHIKEAYVTNLVKDGATEMTKVVTLAPGEYVYFCPLNKTPQYNLTVK